MLRTKTNLTTALLTAISIGISMLAQASAQSSEQSLKFPYQALVLRDGASVHSGPGEVHYSTESLKQSSAVEVYRHDPGGWCAIRPLSGSFSLVPESTLEIIDKGVGQITVDGTQAWVGTKLGVKSAGQIRKVIQRFGIKFRRQPENFVGSKCPIFSFQLRRVWRWKKPNQNRSPISEPPHHQCGR